MCESCDLAELPEYQSQATPEQRLESMKWMETQLRNISEQEKLGVPAASIKIRCGCLKYVPWKYMFRCLYCSIWFCRNCAQVHFGKRVPTEARQGEGLAS